MSYNLEVQSAKWITAGELNKIAKRYGLDVYFAHTLRNSKNHFCMTSIYLKSDRYFINFTDAKKYLERQFHKATKKESE